eukprot:m.263801 g.263801  ORF g.263801 m.263801 type:complete len:753 (-) comp15606_c0_seq1:326-2584(-)
MLCCCEVGLFPPVENIARSKPVTASSTCSFGDFCDPLAYDETACLSGTDVTTCSAQDNSVIALVDTSSTTFWRSETNVDEVTVTLDLLGTHTLFSMLLQFVSERPSAFVVEKSDDNGASFNAMQYYALDCQSAFGMPALTRADLIEVDDVICTSIDQGPGAVNFELFSSSFGPEFLVGEQAQAMDEFTTVTHLRLRMVQLPGSSATEPVLRDAYYALSSVSVSGRVKCNGHASSYSTDAATGNVSCICKHNTEGAQCQSCLPGFNDAGWAQASAFQATICEPCDCNNHADDCVYDSTLDLGVCVDCQHNTQGAHCSNCVDGFYRDTSVAITDPQACVACDCTGVGAVECLSDGACQCKAGFSGRLCDQCADSYFMNATGYCVPCTCDLSGAVSSTCDASGICECNDGFTGDQCSECADGFHTFASGCPECGCNTNGTVGNANVCDKTTAACPCQDGYDGLQCAECAAGFYKTANGACTPCSCNPDTSASLQCDSNGVCECAIGGNYTGTKCDVCIDGLTPSRVLNCAQATGDVVIVVDADSSISPNDFANLKLFLAAMVSSWDIGTGATQVAVVSFGTFPVVLGFLDDSASVSDLQSTLRGISQLGASSSDGREALIRARSVLRDTSRGARPSVPDTLILVTDSTSATDMSATGATLKAEGVLCITIGIGPGASPSQLAAVATSGPLIADTVQDLASDIQLNLLNTKWLCADIQGTICLMHRFSMLYDILRCWSMLVSRCDLDKCIVMQHYV